MHGQLQKIGRPADANMGLGYAPTDGRPESALDLLSIVEKILREILAENGIRDGQDLADKSKESLKHLLTFARDNLPEIVKRQIFRSIALRMLLILPNKFHPAVLLFVDFLVNEQNKILHVSNLDKKSSTDVIYLADILTMPIVLKKINEYKYAYLPNDVVENISRNLKKEGEKEYIKSLVSDLMSNCTRALLGSYEGYIKFFKNGSPHYAHISVRNTLSWVSATRFPPSWGGYPDASGNITGASLCSDVDGWKTTMQFDIFI